MEFMYLQHPGTISQFQNLLCTSRPDLIDPALLRPGRIDLCLYIGFPNLNARVEVYTIT